MTVMDYKMQQYRTIAALSLAHMFWWNTQYLQRYLGEVQSRITQGDMGAADELPELHATCSGLKAFATVRAHGAIEETVRVCACDLCACDLISVQCCSDSYLIEDYCHHVVEKGISEADL